MVAKSIWSLLLSGNANLYLQQFCKYNILTNFTGKKNAVQSSKLCMKTGENIFMHTCFKCPKNLNNLWVIPFIWHRSCLRRNCLNINSIYFHPVHIMCVFLSKHWRTDGLEHWLTERLFSPAANQHLIELTDSGQRIPLPELWKVSVLEVTLSLQGGEKQHSHMDSEAVTLLRFGAGLNAFQK